MTNEKSGVKENFFTSHGGFVPADMLAFDELDPMAHAWKEG